MPILQRKMSVSKGAGGPQFLAGSYTYSDFALPPGEPEAGCIIELDFDGSMDLVRIAGSNVPNISRWDGNNTLDEADYDFRLDVSVGSFNWGPGDPVNTWLLGSAMGGFYAWGVSETGIGTQVGVGTLRIRPTGGGADITTASLSLTGERTP